MISWKLYWSVGGAVLTFAVAGLLALLDVPVLVAVAAVLAVAGVVAFGARKAVYGAEVFNAVPHDGLRQIRQAVSLAVAFNAAVGVFFVVKPDMWLLWAVVLCALAAAEYGIACSHMYLLTRVKPRQEMEKRAAAEVEQHRAGYDETADIAKRAFHLSRHSYLNVLGWEPITSGGQPVGVRYTVRIPSRVAAEIRQKGKEDRTKLDSSDIEPMAIAFSEILHAPLESDFVQITKQKAAGTYTVTVLTKDVMATTYEYVDDLSPASITKPGLIGYEVDGTPRLARFDQHWADVGKSRSGKSSLVNVKFSYVTKCEDALLIVCGTEKLFDLVGPWISPYMGTNFKLPFRIVAGPNDTALAFAAMMELARWRQNQPHDKRAVFKKIVLELDEASFALVIKTVKAFYANTWNTMSQLAEMIVKGAGSAGVHLHLAAQRGTNDNWGDQGGNISANIGAQTVFNTKDLAEIGRATGDYKLPVPRNKGEFWFEPGDGEPPVKLKAPYIQESDPQRDRLHNGATIEDVSWARRNFEHDLDEPSKKFLGEWWDGLHHYATPELYEYLTGGFEQAPEHGSEYHEAQQQVESEVDALFAKLGIEPVAAIEPAPPTAPAVQPVQQPPAAAEEQPAAKSRADRIAEMVTAAGTPMTRAQIIAALAAEGDEASAQTVQNALRGLVSAGRLVQPGGKGGPYASPTLLAHSQ